MGPTLCGVPRTYLSFRGDPDRLRRFRAENRRRDRLQVRWVEKKSTTRSSENALVSRNNNIANRTSGFDAVLFILRVDFEKPTPTRPPKPAASHFRPWRYVELGDGEPSASARSRQESAWRCRAREWRCRPSQGPVPMSPGSNRRPLPIARMW
jgi:hypothetical protein